MREHDLAFQIGDAAQCAQILRLGLLEVQFVGLTTLEELLRNVEAALLQLGVLARDTQARLGRAQREISIGDLRMQQDQRGIAVGLRGKERGVGRLDRAAETPPEIELPSDAQTRTVLQVSARPGIESIRALLRRGKQVGVGLLYLRIASREGDAELRAGLQHAQASDLHIAVVGIGLRDQALEVLVSEYPPPLPDVGL
ncbi:hypothetical protein AWB68_08888 [Caballeronia choica]|uniref:Uncharacterized protein n=1 Tax=Caballeronia choica TaxID=326476 RepID=A0A158L629_9BURK|nr:hypothetical protein AWB68_08888 [Caballeronia choica]